MIVGVNRAFVHDGREYHIQAEDLGVEQASFEVRVYDKGSVLWRKRIAYQEILDQALRALMQKTLQTVQAAIVKGKLG